MAAVGTVDELIDTARTRTGLDDFGSDSFLEGLTVAVASCAADGWLNDLGVTVFREQLIAFLSIRLSVEDQRAVAAAILDPPPLAPALARAIARRTALRKRTAAGSKR